MANDNHDERGRFSSGSSNNDAFAQHLAEMKQLGMTGKTSEADRRAMQRMNREEADKHGIQASHVANHEQNVKAPLDKAASEITHGYQGRTGTRSIRRGPGDD